MITFNTLLEKEPVDLKNVYLVRHQDKRNSAQITTYNLWSRQPSQFEFYQRIQGKDIFQLGKQLASFVVTPKHETLFVGMFRVTGKTVAPNGTECPVSKKDCSGLVLYDIIREETLSEYSGLLSIRWGSGYRKWVQHAFRQPKPIYEIRSSYPEEPFPGFRDFMCDLRDLQSIPERWKDELRKIHGVYLLICRKTGRRYVGSSKGSEGLWQRWQSYVHNNHGNVEFKKIDTSHMQVTILERVDIGLAQIERIESYWKRKLLTDKKYPFGLNAN